MVTEVKQQTISDIVRNDYRTADVFRKYGINYCCGGNSTLHEACTLKDLNPESIQVELSNATKNIVIPASLNFDRWNIDFLVDYISNVHHVYIKETVPSVSAALNSFVNSHRKKLSFLGNLQEVFTEFSMLMLEHTREEDEKIFPYIKQICHTHKNKEIYGRLFVKTMSKPLHQVVQSDHKHIAALLAELRKMANNYHYDDKACTTHGVVFQKLKELDADTMQHKHLENNILFPKAIQMERELLQL